MPTFRKPFYQVGVSSDQLPGRTLPMYVLDICLGSLSLMIAGHHPEHRWYGCRVIVRQYILRPIFCRFVGLTRLQFYISSALSALLRLFLLLHVLQRCVSFFSLDLYPTTLLDFRLHIYDMTAPFSKPTRAQRQTERSPRRSEYGEPTTLNIIKVIQGVSGGWTITDAHLSPDNERFIYHLF